MEKGKRQVNPSRSSGLTPKASQFQKTLKKLGFSNQVVELDKSTGTVQEAARAIGCQIGQIAKSIILKSLATRKPFLIIASGSNQINKKVVTDHSGEAVEIANPDFVLEKTGFTVGGVPPIGHLEPIKTLIDIDLFRHREIWASGGSPKAVFKTTPGDLIKMTRGKIIKVT